MDPASAKMALQIAAALSRSRGLRYLVIAALVTAMMAGVAVVSGPTILTTEIAAAMRGSSQQQGDSGGSCAAEIGSGAPAAQGFTSEQVGNAKIIWTVARQMSEGERGAIVGIATALQESTLRNLPYGDLDSIGLFQQRDSWGSRAVRLNPVDSSHLFFRALNKVKGWQQMSVDMAAQTVQRSAFPSAYANQVQSAVSLVTFLETKYAPGSASDTMIAGAGLCDLGSGSAAGLGKIVLPVDHYVLTAGFGQCGSHWANCHTGLDFACPTGTPIHAVMGGTVIFTGWGGAYGNLTKIQHPDNVQTWYAHQSAIAVKVGETVTAGQTIGRVGATGNTTGPHVHLEVRTSGTPVDPDKWLTDHGVKP